MIKMPFYLKKSFTFTVLKFCTTYDPAIKKMLCLAKNLYNSVFSLFAFPYLRAFHFSCSC